MAKRLIPRAMFETLEGLQTSDLIHNEAFLNLIKAETPLAIKEAFDNKKTFATLFEINELDLFLDIPKTYFIPALEQCIAFKLEEEKFEECIPIKELIEQIRKGTKTIAKTNKPK